MSPTLPLCLPPFLTLSLSLHIARSVAVPSAADGEDMDLTAEKIAIPAERVIDDTQASLM